LYEPTGEKIEQRQKVRLASVLIKDLKHVVGAAITDAIIEAAKSGRPNGRRRKYKPLLYWSDDQNAVSDKKMTRNILVRKG